MPDDPIRAPVSEGKICTPVSAVTIPRFRRRRGRNGQPFLFPHSRGAVSEVTAESFYCKFCRERCRPGGGQARPAFAYFWRSKSIGLLWKSSALEGGTIPLSKAGENPLQRERITFESIKSNQNCLRPANLRLVSLPVGELGDKIA